MIQTLKYIEFNEMIDFIEKKHGIRTRDYYNRHHGNPDAPYCDYWHWLLDNVFLDCHNGSYNYFNPEDFLKEADPPDWVIEITNLITIEFDKELEEVEYNVLNAW